MCVCVALVGLRGSKGGIRPGDVIIRSSPGVTSSAAIIIFITMVIINAITTVNFCYSSSSLSLSTPSSLIISLKQHHCYHYRQQQPFPTCLKPLSQPHRSKCTEAGLTVLTRRDILGCSVLSHPKHCIFLPTGCYTCVKASCSLLGLSCSPELAHTHVVILLLAAAQHLQTNATNNLADTDSATGT